MANEQPAAGGLRMSDQRKETGEPSVFSIDFGTFVFKDVVYVGKRVMMLGAFTYHCLRALIAL